MHMAVDSLPFVAFVVVEPEELRARIASRIRELAKRRKITLSQLAKDSGVSSAHLWAVLGGEHAPSSDVLCKLAKVLRVDPDELVRRPRKPKAT
jgi:transcriptional regulator with XRE-family HTH domain